MTAKSGADPRYWGRAKSFGLNTNERLLKTSYWEDVDLKAQAGGAVEGNMATARRVKELAGHATSLKIVGRMSRS